MAELDFINFIGRHTAATTAPAVQFGIGDDCAVVKKNKTTSTLYTMDSLVEQVHFNLDFHPPYLLGRKSLAVNLSDIGAMGGVPHYALLSISLPSLFKKQDQQEFMAGFFSMCEEFNVALIGGDTVSGDKLSITVTLIGEAQTRLLCSRSGAAPGDEVWVSGFLGESSVGFGLLQVQQGDLFPELVAAHLDPVPQVKLGQFLAESGHVTSMLDISDGVATDLAHICCQSHCGAMVYGDCLPVSAMMKEAAVFLNRKPRQQALVGGEDYELLFTVSAGHGQELASQVQDESGIKLSSIGVIDDDTGVRLQDGKLISEISFQGYEHQ